MSALILPIMNMATVAKRTRIVIIIFSIVFGVEHVLSEGKDTKIILDMQIIQEQFYFRIQNRAKHGIHIVNND